MIEDLTSANPKMLLALGNIAYLQNLEGRVLDDLDIAIDDANEGFDYHVIRPTLAELRLKRGEVA